MGQHTDLPQQEAVGQWKGLLSAQSTAAFKSGDSCEYQKKHSMH